MSQQNVFAILVGETNVLFDLEPADHALFLSLGIALAKIQTLETGLVFFLTTLQIHDPSRKVISETFDQVSSEHTDKTLGTVIKLFREYIKDIGIAEMLEKARKARNYIVHTILKKYGWPFLSPTEYFDAIREVTELTNDISQAEAVIGRYMAEKQPVPIYGVVIHHDTGDIEIIGSKPEK